MPCDSGPSTGCVPQSSSSGCTPIFSPSLERLAVVLRGVVEADGGAVVARRRGDAVAADLRHLVHVDLQLLHRRRAPRLVVVEKRVEGDGVLDGQPGVGDPLAADRSSVPPLDV